MQVDKQRLFRCLSPRSIAVIGGNESETVLCQTQKLGFDGELWAINPKRQSMADIPCIKELEDLPAIPDVVFVGVPAQPTIDYVRQLNQLGVGGVVCLASGFKEVGEEGIQRQQQLIDAAGDMPVLGPNCYGYINTLLGAALFPDQHGLGRNEFGAAIICASGNIGVNFTLQQRGLPVAWLITVGNQAVIGIEEAVAAALENDDITAIGIHIEGIRDLSMFIDLADQARQKRKPIVVLKTGKSPVGASIAMSHTATLAGQSGLYGALFKRLGIAQVDNLEDFLEALKLAAITGPLNGNNLASMSCSGGEASLIADLSENHDLNFPVITDQHAVKLRGTLNDYVSISNPLDYHTFIWGDQPRMTEAFSAMMFGKYDLTLLIIDYPYINDCDFSDWMKTTQAFIEACNRTGSKGAVVASMSENIPAEIHQLLVQNGIAPLHGMRQALVAIEAISRIGMTWRKNQIQPKISVSGVVDADQIYSLDEHQAKNLLSDFSVITPQNYLTRKPISSLTEVSYLSYPVVTKAVSTQIAHKSEINAVVVGVDSDQQLSTEVTRLLSVSGAVMIEQMVQDSVSELLIGISYDQQFGHYLIIGFGGTLVELIADRKILLLPTSNEQIKTALQSLKTWPLLNGFRGRELADVDAVIETVMRISMLVEQRKDEIVELEINPLMVLKQGAVVADAFIQMRK